VQALCVKDISRKLSPFLSTSSRAHARAHTHTHTHTHKHIHTYTRMCAYKCTHIHLKTRTTHTRTMHKHNYTHSYMQGTENILSQGAQALGPEMTTITGVLCGNVYIGHLLTSSRAMVTTWCQAAHPYKLLCIHTSTHKLTRTRARAHTHTHTHTHTLSLTHTHTYTHTHTPNAHIPCCAPKVPTDTVLLLAL